MNDLWDKIRAGAKIKTTKGEEAVYIADSPTTWPIIGFLFGGVEGGIDWRFTEISVSGKTLDYGRTIVLVKPKKQLWARLYKRKRDGFVWADLRYVKEGQPPCYFDPADCFDWLDKPIPVGPLIEESP